MENGNEIERKGRDSIPFYCFVKIHEIRSLLFYFLFLNGQTDSEKGSVINGQKRFQTKRSTCQHKHGGGFSGSVMTEERRYLSLVHVETQLIDRRPRLTRKYLHHATATIHWTPKIDYRHTR